jgi:hypothetical protein
MVVLFAWMGGWEWLVLLGWLASVAGVLTQTGERIAVHLGLSFRRPTAGQAATLLPLWFRALECCAIDPRDVDAYVRHNGESHAFAPGKFEL